MLVSKHQFFELYNNGREDDQWDFKKELKLKPRESFYEFLKDALAFSNSGGGYLLLGVEDKTHELIGVKVRIDEAQLGEKIETNLGFSIKFSLLYFDYEINNEAIELGIMYIYQSEKINVSSKTFTGQKGVIVSENTIYVRRSTRSTKANREDFERIGNRINNSDEYEFKEWDLMLLERNKKYNNSFSIKLEKYLRGEFECTSSEFANKLEELYLYQTKYNKLEFSRLLGFETHKINDYFNGTVLLNLEHILRAITIFNLPSDYFFTPTIHMQYPIWKDPLVSYSIIDKLQYKENLFNYNKNEFFSEVLWQLARAMRTFNNWMYSERPIQNLDDRKIDTRYLFACVENMTDIQLLDFKKHLKTQYYKVLEYCHIQDRISDNLTATEQIINTLIQVNTQIICRIINESIQVICISNGEIEVKLNFFEEIINRKIKRRHYSPETLSLELIDD